MDQCTTQRNLVYLYFSSTTLSRHWWTCSQSCQINYTLPTSIEEIRRRFRLQPVWHRGSSKDRDRDWKRERGRIRTIERPIESVLVWSLRKDNMSCVPPWPADLSSTMALSFLDTTMALEISDALSDYSAQDSTFYEQAPVLHFASTPYALMMSAGGSSSLSSSPASSTTATSVPPAPVSSALKKSTKAKKNVTFLPNRQIQVRINCTLFYSSPVVVDTVCFDCPVVVYW